MRKIFLCIICILILTSCSSSLKEEYDYDLQPIIEISEEAFYDNLLIVACKEATYYLESNNIDKNNITIGDVIHKYGYVNGRLIQLSSPYYVPIFKEDLPLFYVLIYNGRLSDYAPQLVGSSNIINLSNEHFYSSILDFTDLKDHGYNYYPYVYDLINGYFIIFDGFNSRIYTNDYQQESEIRDIEESTINYLINDIKEYKTYSLEEISSEIKEVYLISQEVKDKDYRKLVKEAIRENFGFNLTYSVGKQLDVFKLCYNVDLTVSLIKQNGVNGFYPIYHHGKYFNIAQFAYNDYAGLYCQMVGDYSSLAYNLNQELFDKFNNNDFVIILDEMENGFCLVSLDDMYCYNMIIDEKVLQKVRNYLEAK